MDKTLCPFLIIINYFLAYPFCLKIQDRFIDIFDKYIKKREKVTTPRVNLQNYLTILFLFFFSNFTSHVRAAIGANDVSRNCLTAFRTNGKLNRGLAVVRTTNASAMIGMFSLGDCHFSTPLSYLYVKVISPQRRKIILQ